MVSGVCANIGIDPAIYLCALDAFAVRRFPGRTASMPVSTGNLAAFEFQGSPSSTTALPPHLPRNRTTRRRYPKHVWAFIFTEKPFRKKGPVGYQLGHLADHKEHGNRWREELDFVGGLAAPPLLFGLFTSAANAAYFPSAFLRPTDFSFHLRSLVQRRAQQLYGEVCQLLPPGLEVKPCRDPEWDLERFRWSPPVGQTTNVAVFLEYRRSRIDELLQSRGTETRPASGEFEAASPISTSSTHLDGVETA